MLEAKYQVVHLEKSQNMIKIILLEEHDNKLGAVGQSGKSTPSKELTPITQPPSPDITEDTEKTQKALQKITSLKQKITSLKQTDEEKMVSRIFEAAEKQMPGLREAMSMGPQQMKMTLIPYKPKSFITLQLTKKQYRDLGKPQFLQVISLKILMAATK